MTSALVAQWIEHLTTDQKVGGSSPFGRAVPRNPLRSSGPGKTHLTPTICSASLGQAGRAAANQPRTDAIAGITTKSGKV